MHYFYFLVQLFIAKDFGGGGGEGRITPSRASDSWRPYSSCWHVPIWCAVPSVLFLLITCRFCPCAPRKDWPVGFSHELSQKENQVLGKTKDYVQEAISSKITV